MKEHIARKEQVSVPENHLGPSLKNQATVLINYRKGKLIRPWYLLKTYSPEIEISSMTFIIASNSAPIWTEQ